MTSIVPLESLVLVNTGEIAILDRHRIGCALAVRGVAVGRIHIDRVGTGVEARSSVDGTAGVPGNAGVFFPLDLHIANLGQGRALCGINTVTNLLYSASKGHYNRDS